MHTTWDETERYMKKQAEELYYTYINMGVEAQKKEEHILSESYYQQAEYYLHCMNEEGPFSLDSSDHAQKILGRVNRKKLSAKKSSDSEASNTQRHRKQHNVRTEPLPPTHQAVIIPFKPNFLRRKRRETPQSNKEDTSSSND